MLSALDRGEEPGGGGAADLLHECLIEALSNEPLLPTESGPSKPIGACVLPSPLLGREGGALPERAGEGREVGRRRVPECRVLSWPLGPRGRRPRCSPIDAFRVRGCSGHTRRPAESLGTGARVRGL